MRAAPYMEKGDVCHASRVRTRLHYLEDFDHRKWGNCKPVYLNFLRLSDCQTRGFEPVTRRFELVTRGFKLVTRGFGLITREFKLVTREFELVTRGFEFITRGFKLVTREFQLVTRKVELLTRKFELVDLNSHFWISTCAFKLSTRN